MADLLAVDIQISTPQQTVSTTNNNNSESDSKFFDSLVNEYTGQENLEPQNVQQTENENLITFTGGKLFSSSVIEILAANAPEEAESDPALMNFDVGENIFAQLKSSLTEVKNSQPEVFYTDDEIKLNDEISQLLNMSGEELNEKLAALPEDLQAEAKKLIEEIINAVKNGKDVAPALEKLSGILAKPEIKVQSKISDSESDSERENKIEDENDNGGEKINSETVNTAGLANVQSGNKISDAEAKPEKDSLISVDDDGTPGTKQNQNLQRAHREVVHNAVTPDNENDDAIGTPKAESNFRELIENRETSNENENQNNFSGGNENENENQNFDQARDFLSNNRNQSRQRNDNRRISNEASRAENERNFNSTSHRTDSRNDFQTFFDGILENRRTSTASPQPLDLRGNFNFNQSETLRNGLVNVVRFIRADGVQKANVVVDPPALGRISVELTSGTSGVEASIKVASEQIRQLIQDQLTQLRMNLAEQGVQVAEFTVDVQQDNQQNGRNPQQENQQDGRGNFINGVEDDNEEEFRVDLNEGLLYWVA